MADPGALVVTDRFDITLEAITRVAWQGERLVVSEEALEAMDRCAAAFDALVTSRVRADSQALIYGVTSAPGDRATLPLGPEAQASRPSRLWTAMSYGESLPVRVTRAIALARLANFLGGHAAVRSELAAAIAGMLNVGPLPVVPGQSNGGAGEILALGTLFYDLSGRIELSAKERMALINGSPCAAALIADTALAGRARLAVAERVFALVADVTDTPQEHYAPELEELWGDEHETAALRSLRAIDVTLAIYPSDADAQAAGAPNTGGPDGRSWPTTLTRAPFEPDETLPRLNSTRAPIHYERPWRITAAAVSFPTTTPPSFSSASN